VLVEDQTTSREYELDPERFEGQGSFEGRADQQHIKQRKKLRRRTSKAELVISFKRQSSRAPSLIGPLSDLVISAQGRLGEAVPLLLPTVPIPLLLFQANPTLLQTKPQKNKKQT